MLRLMLQIVGYLSPPPSDSPRRFLRYHQPYRASFESSHQTQHSLHTGILEGTLLRHGDWLGSQMLDDLLQK